MPTNEDLGWIRAFRRAVAADIDGLAGVAREELGKPAFETVASDIVPLLTACRWHERRARRVLRARRVGGGSLWQLGQRHRVVRAPLGRVAIIATWNYPVHLLGVQVVQAIAGGNRVVVKPSERCPETHGRLLRLARDAGMGEARLAWTDATREAGEELLEREAFDHVVFTGSTRVGRAIAGTLAPKLTPSSLELSGRDSAIVLADADVDLAARSILFGVSLNRGRTCMGPRRVIVVEGVADAFCAAVERHLARANMPAGVDSPEQDQARAVVEEAITHGGRLLGPGINARGVLVVEGADPDGPLARGDHFGAALAVVRAHDTPGAVEVHRRSGQHLSTSVFTRDVAGARALAPSLGSGMVTINDCVVPTAHPGVSLGGRGPSGWGVTQGELGLMAMTRPVFVSSTGRVIRTPIAPQSPDRERAVTRFVKWWYGR